MPEEQLIWQQELGKSPKAPSLDEELQWLRIAQNENQSFPGMYHLIGYLIPSGWSALETYAYNQHWMNSIGCIYKFLCMYIEKSAPSNHFKMYVYGIF